MDDVRNLGGRILIGIATVLCGALTAIGAALLADWMVHHPPAHMGGEGTGQSGFFGVGSMIFGFILGGAAGGIGIEVIRRRWQQRRLHRALPRMTVVRSA